MSLFLYRIASESDAEFFEYLSVNFTKHHGRVNLTSIKLRKLFESASAILISCAEQREGNEHFIRVEARVASVKEGNFCQARTLEWVAISFSKA